jgi:GntP family gluconate:H+ symporter
MLSPGMVLVIGSIVLIILMRFFRWTLPAALLAVAIIAALLSGFGIPFRHLVEGGFGYINLVLALFAGAFFGQVMHQSGIADAFATKVHVLLRGNAWLMLVFAAVLLFSVGMFVGIAGVSVLATGVLVVPMLRRIGLESPRIGAFIAVVATCGMIAPPVNVPAMTIADGVNMPYLGFAWPLLVLSVPPTILMIVLCGTRLRGAAKSAADVSVDGRLAALGLFCLALVLGFWTLLRLFPTVVPDPAAPIVLIAGALVALPALGRNRLQQALSSTFSGTPLVLAAVLVTVGVAVQIMTLTGIRGWLVINSMAFPPPWTFVEMVVIPIFGGVLTSIGAANILGVPFAFALIHQDMILNVSGLSAIAALSEFMPPTALAAALATYIVGDTTLWAVLRKSIPAVISITVIAILMLVFADALSGLLIAETVTIREH